MYMKSLMLPDCTVGIYTYDHLTVLVLYPDPNVRNNDYHLNVTYIWVWERD